MVGKKDEKIVVAMSGGVDSALAAAWCKKEGYTVIGITLQLYDAGRATSTRSRTCCAGVDIEDARRAADAIGIDHYVLNYEQRFRREVIDDFVAAYRRGETPIPCIQCNQKIKFRDLLIHARSFGATALATGHYVRRRIGANHRAELWRGRDHRRDQSYFLFNTSQEQLRFLRFPIGDMLKKDVRDLARQWNIPVAEKPDSQDICFVPDRRYASLIDGIAGKEDDGDIVHLDGTVLGRHHGISRFTVGQRRGLGIGGDQNRPEEPLYVIAIDARQGRVVVGPRRALACTGILLRSIDWIDTALPDFPFSAHMQFRSSQEPIPVRVEKCPIDDLADPSDRPSLSATFPSSGSPSSGTPSSDRLSEKRHAFRVTATIPLFGVSPGQACVFYDGDRLLGGGWIAKSVNRHAHPMPADGRSPRPTADGNPSPPDY